MYALWRPNHYTIRCRMIKLQKINKMKLWRITWRNSFTCFSWSFCVLPWRFLFVHCNPFFVWVSAKFGTCTAVSINGTLVEDKMGRFKGACAHFRFNKCPIYTHDGANAKFSTNSHKTDYSAWVRVEYLGLLMLTLSGLQLVDLSTRPLDLSTMLLDLSTKLLDLSTSLPEGWFPSLVFWFRQVRFIVSVKKIQAWDFLVKVALVEPL